MKRVLLLLLSMILIWEGVTQAESLPDRPSSPTSADLQAAQEAQQFLPEATACTGTNLLLNPSFEGEYQSYRPPSGHPDCPAGICTTAQMANGWLPFWRSHNSADPGHIIRMPEWKPATSNFINPPRVKTGDRAQQYFTFYATHSGGMYQRVSNVTVGQSYCFSVWGHSWSSNSDGTAYTDPNNHGYLNQRIGIDPTGGTNWLSPSVIWTTPTTQYDNYAVFRLEAVAQSSSMTVFMHSEPLWAFKHNDVYWDDAVLAQKAVTAPPSFSVNKTWWEFSSRADDPETHSADLVLLLNHAPHLTWQATIDPTSHFTPILSRETGTASDTALTIRANTHGLAVGEHTARIFIVASDPNISGGRQMVTLNLDILAAEGPPTIRLDDFTVNYLADQRHPGRYLLVQPLILDNAQGMQWFAYDYFGQNVKLGYLQQRGVSGQSLRVSFDSDGLALGKHTAFLKVKVDHPAYVAPDKTITINMTVRNDLHHLYLPLLTKPR